jgi:hypothetical protein
VNDCDDCLLFEAGTDELNYGSVVNVWLVRWARVSCTPQLIMRPNTRVIVKTGILEA